MIKILKKIIKWFFYFVAGIIILGIVSLVFIMHKKNKDYEKRNEACASLKAGQTLNVFDFAEKYSKEATVSVELTGGQKEFFYRSNSHKISPSSFAKYEKMTGKVGLFTGETPSWHFYCNIDLVSGEITKVSMSGIE